MPSRTSVDFADMRPPAEGRAMLAFLTADPDAPTAPIRPKAMPVLLAEKRRG